MQAIDRYELLETANILPGIFINPDRFPVHALQIIAVDAAIVIAQPIKRNGCTRYCSQDKHKTALSRVYKSVLPATHTCLL